jgi:hypothetical protein
MNLKQVFWVNIFLVFFWLFVGFINVADNLIIQAPLKRTLILAVIYLLIISTCLVTAITLKFKSVAWIRKLALFSNYSVLVFLFVYLVISITKHSSLYVSLLLQLIFLLTSIINLRVIRSFR